MNVARRRAAVLSSRAAHIRTQLGWAASGSAREVPTVMSGPRDRLVGLTADRLCSASKRRSKGVLQVRRAGHRTLDTSSCAGVTACAGVRRAHAFHVRPTALGLCALRSAGYL